MLEQYQILKQLEEDAINGNNNFYTRDCFYSIDWNFKAIGLFGERGVGKTTILLQKRIQTENSFYFSADNTIVKSNGLFLFVFYCVKELGIENFFIDEIFRYGNWKQEIKNIIDSFSKIKIVFSGSSSMALYDGVIDLGRRVLNYKINTLSFREFLRLKYKIDLPKISFEELIKSHKKLSLDYSLKLKEKYFKEYLKSGAYPFGLDLNFPAFSALLHETLNRIIFEDLQYIKNFETKSLDKLSKLIYFIATTTPSDLSINHLSKKIQIDKNSVDNVLYLLNKIGTVNLVQKGDKLSEKIRKEYKIFLGDTNKYFVHILNPEIGTIREAFFVNEIKKLENIEISLLKGADFKLEIGDKTYNFEIGGKNKQISKYKKGTFIVKDNITVTNEESVIPLWLFGFLN